MKQLWAWLWHRPEGPPVDKAAILASIKFPCC